MKWSSMLAAGSLCCFGLAPRATAEHAAECGGQRPWVAVDAGAAGSLSARLLSDLRAGLAPSSIDVCDSALSPAAQPLARVTVTRASGTGARFSVDVTDSVTEKRVGRDLDLERLPEDGRALALAVAAEELLRASWAELALRGLRRPETAAPPEVRAVVERERRAEPLARYTALGARLAFEHFLGGQTQYGADLFAQQPVASVAALVAALGVRRSLSVQAPHGSIDASGISAELGLSLCMLRTASVELSSFASARALRLAFEPSAEEGVQAAAATGFAVVARAGLGFAFGTPGVLRSYSTLGAGLPLKSFAASDSGALVTGASKLELFATTGVAVELR